MSSISSMHTSRGSISSTSSDSRGIVTSTQAQALEGFTLMRLLRLRPGPPGLALHRTPEHTRTRTRTAVCLVQLIQAALHAT